MFTWGSKKDEDFGMKLNWAERWVVNTPARVVQQRFEIGWMKRAMSIESGSAILEIGCGRAAGAKLILDAFQPGRFHAMDLDIDMIRRAHRYLSTEERERISLYVGDATALPYRDQSWDAVFGFGFLHHVVDWRSAISEIARVLRPGGAYFLEEIYPFVYQNLLTRYLVPHPKEDRFRSEELRAALQKSHFVTRKTLEVKPVGILGVFVKRS